MPESPSWVQAPGGYQLAVVDGRLRCRDATGALLESVPRVVEEGARSTDLEALATWMSEHERVALEAVERWMLRGLATPTRLLGTLLDDPVWHHPLLNTVLFPVSPEGTQEPSSGGLLQAVDRARGVGLVGLCGEMRWVDTRHVVVPHPLRLEERDGYRDLVRRQGVEQGISQVFRDTFVASRHAADAVRISDFAGGRFERLHHAEARSRTLGYRVREGYVTCHVAENGVTCSARYRIGAARHGAEVTTGDLEWVVGKGPPLLLNEVGPVAFSEGVRMARAVYGARVRDTAQPAAG